MSRPKNEDKGLLLQGKALGRHHRFQQALAEFTAMFAADTNERSIALVGATFLDTTLEDILRNFLVDDEKEVTRLLEPDQVLGTYGSRTTVVYCLGLIPKIIRDDLRLVGKIRNRFAHDLNASFDDDPIRSWCLSLKWHETSMFMKPPDGATVRDIYQVGVNQLICYLNGIIALKEQRKIQDNP